MKFRYGLISMVFVLFLSFFLVFCTVVQVKSSDVFNTPDGVVKAFYKDYLDAFFMSDIESRFNKSVNAILKYTTKHLRGLQNRDESGADYFTAAQSFCPEWTDNIRTSNIHIVNDTASLNVSLGYENNSSEYYIKLVKVDGKWLMDSVLFKSAYSGYCGYITGEQNVQ